MKGEVRCRAVVVRSHEVEAALPWPHWIGALTSEETRPGFTPPELPSHPYRPGEFLRTIALSGEMDALELGTAIAAICLYGGGDEDGAPRDAEAVLRELLACEAVIVGGGVEVEVDGRVVLRPECCAGLEGWREWIVFAEGGPPPWCGHGPEPHVMRRASGELEIGYEEREVAIVSVGSLRAALREVERELAGFTEALARWASAVAPTLAETLVERLARDLALRA